MLRRNLFVRISSLAAFLLFSVGVAMLPSQNLAADEIRNSSDFFKIIDSVHIYIAILMLTMIIF